MIEERYECRGKGWSCVSSEFEKCNGCGYIAHIYNPHVHRPQDGPAQRQMEAERYARSLWACYHVITEKFDRTVCTGSMGRDGILPGNGREYNVVNWHARCVRDVVTAASGMTVMEFRKCMPNDRRDHQRVADLSGLLPAIESQVNQTYKRPLVQVGRLCRSL